MKIGALKTSRENLAQGAGTPAGRDLKRRRVNTGAVTTIMALAALAGAGAAHAATPTPVLPDAPFLSAQRLVAVDGARRINLFCLGEGKPVVILDSGAGGGMMFWRHVLAAIGGFTQVCAYDRAGYGFSDPASRASDAANTVDDLHRLLHAAGLATPIVYVGHSIAGLYGVLFAATYPAELAGAVFIDPAFPHQRAAMEAADTPAQRAAAEAAGAKQMADMKGCLALAQKGELASPKTKQARDCMDPSGDPEPLDAALLAEANRQWSQPPRNATAVSEIANVSSAPGQIDVDAAELDARQASFGDKPLVVLTHGKQDPPTPAFTVAQQKAAAVAWNAGHDALAKLSTRGSNRLVPEARHFIQIDQPNAVIDAVQEVVAAVRSSR